MPMINRKGEEIPHRMPRVKIKKTAHAGTYAKASVMANWFQLKSMRSTIEGRPFGDTLSYLLIWWKKPETKRWS